MHSLFHIEGENDMLKTERLLSMIIYLLNHKRVSASQLAQRYDVSPRTIQRDIDTLTLAGIPIIAYMGTSGGYELMEDYRMHVQLADEHDYQIMQIALNGLHTAICNMDIQDTYEKVRSLPHPSQDQMILDFSVLQEQADINENLQFLQDHITSNSVISFTYQNAQKEVSVKQVDPYAIVYKWYAWYLLAYDRQKKENRIYKVKRMQELCMVPKQIQERQVDVPAILETIFSKDEREYYDIRVRCQKGCNLSMEEYIHGQCEEVNENGDYIMVYHLPKNEALWKGVPLGYAGEIEIITPKEVRELFVEKCRGFIKQNG